MDVNDANLLIDRMTARMQIATDPFSVMMKAISWQYTGGGLKGSPSTLDALTDSQEIKADTETIKTLIQQMPTAAQIAAAIVVLLPAGALTKDDVTEAVLEAFRMGTESTTSS